MSVSDQSNGSERPRGANRKPQVALSKEQWEQCRIQYETGDLPLAKLASLYRIALSTISKRCQKGKWRKGQAIVAQARSRIAAGTDQALAELTESAVAKVKEHLMDRLGPWIEREKVRHVKDAVKRAKGRHKALDALHDGLGPKLTSKDAAYIAKADDTYDVIKRRNLGLNDGDSGIGSALSVRVLNGDVAVEVTQT